MNTIERKKFNNIRKKKRFQTFIISGTEKRIKWIDLSSQKYMYY